MIQYGWMFLLGGSVIGVLMRGFEAWNKVANPEIFKRELLPYLIWLGLGMVMPWATMGALLVSGLVPDGALFIAKAQPNVWVTLWKWLFFLETVAVVYWISFGRGAHFLVRYPFLLNLHRADERMVRVAAGLLWLVVWTLVGTSYGI